MEVTKHYSTGIDDYRFTISPYQHLIKVEKLVIKKWYKRIFSDEKKEYKTLYYGHNDVIQKATESFDEVYKRFGTNEFTFSGPIAPTDCKKDNQTKKSDESLIIKDNRVVHDRTFAPRFLFFLNNVQVNDPMNELELEYLRIVAKKLLDYQIKTAENEEREYLKRCYPSQMK